VSRVRAPGAALALAILLSGCLTPVPGPDGAVDMDPYERSNRMVFAFNEGLDKVLLEPLGRGWRFITPRALRRAIDSAMTNLEFPVRAVSCLGQGRPGDAGWETLRFLTNTTVGVIGLWDPATRLFDIPFFDEDVGQMFAVWGIGSGPYWVVPFVGPSGPRDLTGYALDRVLDLLPWQGAAIEIINDRAILVPTIDRARESSLDYYVFVRNAYLQLRKAKIADRGPSAGGQRLGADEELYRDDEGFYRDDDELYEPEDGAGPEGEGGVPPAPEETEVDVEG
jgi:phospholipid-binding lipoprotein MlaA